MRCCIMAYDEKLLFKSLELARFVMFLESLLCSPQLHLFNKKVNIYIAF